MTSVPGNFRKFTATPHTRLSPLLAMQKKPAGTPAGFRVWQPESSDNFSSMKLLFFSRPSERRHAGLATLNRRGDFIKVAGADFLLV